MKSLLASLLLALPLTAAAAESSLRSESQDLNLWVNPMVGVGRPKLGIGLGVNASKGMAMAAYRFVGLDDFCIMCSEPSESSVQHQALAGLKMNGRVGYVAVLSGLSFDRGRKVEPSRFSGELEESGYDSFGVPVVLDAHLATPIIGLGFSVFANLNPEQTTSGFFLSLPLGYVRPFRSRAQAGL